MGKSNAERQREYRARRNADAEEYLRKERERWKRDTEAGKKKSIHDLSKRAQRHKRKEWRKAKERQKWKAENDNSGPISLTPPHSPDSEIQDAVQARPESSRHPAGKKASRKATDTLRKEIEELKRKLKHQKKQKEKYKKRLQRATIDKDSPRSKVRQLLKNCTVNSKVRKTLLHHEALIHDIGIKYKNARNEKGKKTVAEVVVGTIVKKYRLQRYTDTSLESKVKTFFTRDDVSRMTTGKKQTMTKKKIKMQKRFLVDTMKNLHRKFLAENNTSHISYASFCRLRPFWVVHPFLSDRDTCQCRLHENLGFLADTLKLIGTSNLESLTELVCCDTGSKACMYGECEVCKNRIVPLSSSYNGAQKVTYMQWATEDKAKLGRELGRKNNSKANH
ncbi:hypothetical protein ABVT39_012719 [Epinephelus coioides]